MAVEPQIHHWVQSTTLFDRVSESRVVSSRVISTRENCRFRGPSCRHGCESVPTRAWSRLQRSEIVDGNLARPTAWARRRRVIDCVTTLPTFDVLVVDPEIPVEETHYRRMNRHRNIPCYLVTDRYQFTALPSSARSPSRVPTPPGRAVDRATSWLSQGPHSCLAACRTPHT